MTLEDAKGQLAAGKKFGDVYPKLEYPTRDGDALRRYFVHGDRETVPCGAPRPPAAPIGDCCGRCGGPNLVRTGTCLTCQDCGDSSGGC